VAGLLVGRRVLEWGRTVFLFYSFYCFLWWPLVLLLLLLLLLLPAASLLAVPRFSSRSVSSMGTPTYI
jgi:hypothetical protein